MAWGDANNRFESFGEVALIGKAGFSGNLGDGLASSKQLFGLGDANVD